MIVCAQCGKKNKDNATVCKHCGYNPGALQANTMSWNYQNGGYAPVQYQPPMQQGAQYYYDADGKAYTVRYDYKVTPVDEDEEEDYEDEEETPRKKEKKLPRETVWAALRGELSEEELAAVVQKPVAQEDYYDFDMLLAGIHRFMAGEVSREYYRDWVILVAWALGANPFEENSKRALLYEELSYAFDGHSFRDMEEEREAECREMIAALKWFNHRRMHLRKSNLPPFCNEEGVAVYVHFSHCNRNNAFYNVCVVDTAKKCFHLGQVVNPDYREDVNYAFVNAGEFEDLSNTYYEFFHDRSMDLCHYLPERYYLDENDQPIK